MPRWVRVFVVIGVLLLVALIVTQFAGGGHGPGRHGGADETPTEPAGEHQPTEHAP
jgi:hypothetical protein